MPGFRSKEWRTNKSIQGSKPIRSFRVLGRGTCGRIQWLSENRWNSEQREFNVIEVWHNFVNIWQGYDKTQKMIKRWIWWNACMICLSAIDCIPSMRKRLQRLAKAAVWRCRTGDWLHQCPPSFHLHSRRRLERAHPGEHHYRSLLLGTKRIKNELIRMMFRHGLALAMSGHVF